MENSSLNEVSSLPERYRQLLMCLNEEHVSGGRQQKELQISVGKELSQMLLEKNGLTYLLLACDDLGGESFWQNSAAVSAIVKILSKKPSSVKSADKYYAYVLRHLLLLFKNERWNKKLSMLFSLAVDRFAEMSPLPVQVNIIDKLLHPFDLLLERGNLNLRLFDSNGSKLWSENLDKAMWVLSRWLNVRCLSAEFSIPFCDRLLKCCPFLLHLLGQAIEIKREVNNDTFDDFIADLNITVQRMLQSFSIGINQVEYLVNEILLQSNKPRLLTSKHNAYFELGCANNIIAPSTTAKVLIAPIENEEKSCLKHYPMVSIAVREEAYTIQELVDFKFTAIQSYLKLLPREECGRLLFSMLTTVFKECQKSPMKNVDGQSALGIASTSNFRFVEVDQDLLTPRDEDSIFLPHYVLTRLIELLSEFDFTGFEDKLDEKNLLEIVDVAEDITDSYKNKMYSSNEPTRPSAKKLDDLLAWMEPNEEPALCGHALIEIAKALRQRDTKLFSTADDFVVIYDKLLEHMQNSDSYIFLAAINALAELAYWKTEPFLRKLVQLFVEWNEKEDQAGAIDEGSNLRDCELMMRCKLGEAVAKVSRQLGDFSLVYFDELANTYLCMIKSWSDELVRASTLSSLADLVVACRGRYFDKILAELLLCISEILSSYSSSKNNKLVRRAAIHLLRSMITSVRMDSNGSIFETFTSSLAPIARQLKMLWSTDDDDIVRLHSELALIEIQEALEDSMDYALNVGQRKIL